MLSALFDASGYKNIGATICIGREIRCLPYAGCFLIYMIWKIVKYKELSYCFSALQFRKRITSSFLLVLSLLIYCTLLYFILFALMAFCFCYTLLNTTATPFFSLIKLQCSTAVQLVFTPFSQLIPQLELYSQLQLSLWSNPLAFSVPKST